MTVQFRILDAAIRLVRFTLLELSRESGVRSTQAWKLVRTRPDLFSPAGFKPRRIYYRTRVLFTGKNEKSNRRRVSWQALFRVDMENARRALQSRANRLALPPLPGNSSGEPLSILLLEDTLVRVFPRADPGERRALLAAAQAQLSMTSTTGSRRVEDFERLHRRLSILNEAQSFLTELASRGELAREEAALNNQLVYSLELLLTAKADANAPAELGRFTLFPIFLASIFSALGLTSSAHKKFFHDILMAIWALLGNRSWSALEGSVDIPYLANLALKPPRTQVRQIQRAPSDPFPLPAHSARRTPSPIAESVVSPSKPSIWTHSSSPPPPPQSMEMLTSTRRKGFNVHIHPSKLSVYWGTSLNRKRGVIEVLYLDCDAQLAAEVGIRETDNSITTLPYRAVESTAFGGSSSPRHLFTRTDRKYFYFSEDGGQATTKRASCSWIDQDYLAIHFEIEDQIDVIDNSIPGADYLMTPLQYQPSTASVGKVISITIHLASGSMTSALIRFYQQRKISELPMNTLYYHEFIECFIISNARGALAPAVPHTEGLSTIHRAERLQ